MQHLFLYVSLLFGILSGDFQHTNRLANVALTSDRLPVIRVVLSYLKTNSSQYSLAYFQNKCWPSQDTFYLLYQGYTNIFSVIGYP